MLNRRPDQYSPDPLSSSSSDMLSTDYSHSWGQCFPNATCVFPMYVSASCVHYCKLHNAVKGIN